MLVIMACGDRYDGPPISDPDEPDRTLRCRSHGAQQLASLRTHITQYLTLVAPVPCNASRIAANIPATGRQVGAELAAMEAEHVVACRAVSGSSRWILAAPPVPSLPGGSRRAGRLAMAFRGRLNLVADTAEPEMG